MRRSCTRKPTPLLCQVEEWAGELRCAAFMERHVNGRTPDLSRAWSRRSPPSGQFPSWEGLGGGFRVEGDCDRTVPMDTQKRKRALHGPPVWSPGFSRFGPPEGGTPYRWHDPDGFMVLMHGRKSEGALHEPHEFQAHSPVESGGTPPHPKTLARGYGAPKIRQVLDCAAAAALWISHGVSQLAGNRILQPQYANVW